MRKYIVRTQGVRTTCNEEHSSLHDAVLKDGIDSVLRTVFTETASYEELLQGYNQFLQTGTSEMFAWLYELTETCGVIIDAHITLCKLDPDMTRQQENILPWRYFVSQRYVADTWWFTDEEILKDISELSLIDFLEKYNGLI